VRRRRTPLPPPRLTPGLACGCLVVPRARAATASGPIPATSQARAEPNRSPADQLSFQRHFLHRRVPSTPGVSLPFTTNKVGDHTHRPACTWSVNIGTDQRRCRSVSLVKVVCSRGASLGHLWRSRSWPGSSGECLFSSPAASCEFVRLVAEMDRAGEGGLSQIKKPVGAGLGSAEQLVRF